MHLVDVEHGFHGGDRVVGGNVPIALGSALAATHARRRLGRRGVLRRRRRAGRHFNETVNLATLWQLPIILVCENNGFPEFTPRSAHTNVERVSDVVAPYELERAPSTATMRSPCGRRSVAISRRRAKGAARSCSSA